MSPLRDKIQVEPLDDVRLDRIEHNVLAAYNDAAFARSRQRDWRAVLRLAVPMIAVAGVGLAIFLNARAASSRTDIIVVERGGPATKIVTDDRGGSVVDLGDAKVTLGVDTSLEVLEDEHGVRLTLHAGRVDCSVEPKDGRLPFVVVAGDVSVTVVGTVFSVERDHEVRVRVTRGKVRVENPNGADLVAAGQDWAGPATMTASNDSTTGPGSDFGDEPDEQTSASPAYLDAPETPGVDSLETRTAKLPDTAPEPTHVSKSRTKAPANKTSKKPEYTEAIYRTKALDAAKIAWPSGGEDLRALKELAYSDPKEAIRKLRVLVAQTKSEEAADAMFTIALVQYYKLDNAAQAIKTARQYERRFSGGLNLEGVLVLRIKAQCQIAHDDKCRSAAYTYLRRFPYGDHATLASEIVNWGM